MANEKIGITIEVQGTGAGVKSVKELKDEVKKLDETIKKTDFGSDEYKKATAESEKLRAKMDEISGKESTKMATSLKALQQEYKKLKVALSEAANPDEFKRLSQELNDVEGKIGDINDAANIATGSGIEQLNKGLALTMEGFRNFDFEKIKIGFKGIGNAMSAVAPLALIAGLTLLIENFDQIVFWAKKITGAFTEQELRVQSLTKALEVQTAITTKVNKDGKLGIISVDDDEMDSLGLVKIEEKKYSFFASFPAGVAKTWEKLNSYIDQFKKVVNPSTGGYKAVGGFKRIASIFPTPWDWQAFWSASRKFRPMAITSPTDFICKPSR